MKNKKFKQYKSDLTISDVRENSTGILNISSVKCFAMTCKSLFIRVSDPLQECPLNARRVPSKAPQFSKNWQLRPPFLAYFYLPQITKPL